MADRQANSDPAVETGVRHEYLAGLVHSVNKPLVRGVQLGIG